MSHFYGTVAGQVKTEATRRGSANSGLTTLAAGRGGAIRTTVFREGDTDYYMVELVPWQGSGGRTRVIARGVLDSTRCEHQNYASLCPDCSELA